MLPKWISSKTNYLKSSPLINISCDTNHLLVVYRNVGQVCRHPVLPVNAPEMMKFIKKMDKFHCDPEKNWVEVNGSTAFITDEAKALHGEIECSFTGKIESVLHYVFTYNVGLA